MPARPVLEAGSRRAVARPALRPLWPRLRRILLRIVLVALLAPPALLLIYRFVPVPVTPLMLIRLGQGEGLDKDWVPLEQIAPALAESVVASEDNQFCEHWGFDWEALKGEVESLPRRRARARRQHDHPADREEPVPLAGPEPVEEGARGAA